MTYSAGTFRGDDHEAPKIIIRDVTQPAVNMVTMDPSGSQGPMVVQYKVNMGLW